MNYLYIVKYVDFGGNTKTAQFESKTELDREHIVLTCRSAYDVDKIGMIRVYQLVKSWL